MGSALLLFPQSFRRVAPSLHFAQRHRPPRPLHPKARLLFAFDLLAADAVPKVARES